MVLKVELSMRVVGLPRRLALVGSVAIVTAWVTGCSSSGPHVATPQGLTGQQASAFANSQISVEDREAQTVLAPAAGSFLSGKTTVTLLGSTTPSNGDENPYAIWPVTQTVGSLKAGDVLVDNFNNKSNDQGTGTTIVDVHPDGSTTVFADFSAAKSQCPGGVGLTTAMVGLKTGWVIVGSLPSTDGTTNTAGQGCLLVISPTGTLAETLTGSYLDGPWDAAVADDGDTASLFVANTLVGLAHSPTATAAQGDVVRLSLSQTATSAPKITAETTVASGLSERGDPSAFVKGPTGLALGSDGTLYIADNLNNRILAVPQALTVSSSAGTGSVLTSGGQLAASKSPDGDLLAANAVNGKIVEITPAGKQVGEYYAIQNVGQDPAGNGDLFGIAINQAGTGVIFVKDDENTLALLHS
jgi:sugar lactone lactonase YvrE